MATLVNSIRFLKRPTNLDGTCYVPQCSKFFLEKSIKYQLKKGISKKNFIFYFWKVLKLNFAILLLKFLPYTKKFYFHFIFRSISVFFKKKCQISKRFKFYFTKSCVRPCRVLPRQREKVSTQGPQTNSKDKSHPSPPKWIGLWSRSKPSDFGRRFFKNWRSCMPTVFV